MKARTLIPLIIGLGVGFFAIKMGVDMVKKAKGAPAETAAIYVSAQPIEVATRITDTMVREKSVPSTLVPQDAFTDPEKLVGRVTGMSIVPGVPITKRMLAPPGSEPGLRAKIPAGYRAVSLKVNEESAVAGFIMPGCRVDVLVAVRKGQEFASRVILSDVEVGAVGQSLSQVGKDGKTVRMTKSVTLFLKPEEVQTLHSNSGTGRFRLALRGNSGEASKSSWPEILSKISGAMNKPEVKAPEPVKAAPVFKHHIVEAVRGDKKEWLVFDGTGGARRFADNPSFTSPLQHAMPGMVPEEEDDSSSEMEMFE